MILNVSDYLDAGAVKNVNSLANSGSWWIVQADHTQEFHIIHRITTGHSQHAQPLKNTIINFHSNGIKKEPNMVLEKLTAEQ